MKTNLTDFVIAFPVIAAGILGWFLNRYMRQTDQKHSQVAAQQLELATIRSDLESIKNSLNSFEKTLQKSLAKLEATIEKSEEKREKQLEDFYKVKSRIDAAWVKIDSMIRENPNGPR